MVIVFALPCVFLALGYIVGQALMGLSETAALLTALVGLAVGFVPAYLVNRSIAKSDEPAFRILKRLY